MSDRFAVRCQIGFVSKEINGQFLTKLTAFIFSKAVKKYLYRFEYVALKTQKGLSTFDIQTLIIPIAIGMLCLFTEGLEQTFFHKK